MTIQIKKNAEGRWIAILGSNGVMQLDVTDQIGQAILSEAHHMAQVIEQARKAEFDSMREAINTCVEALAPFDERD